MPTPRFKASRQLVSVSSLSISVALALWAGTTPARPLTFSEPTAAAMRHELRRIHSDLEQYGWQLWADPAPHQEASASPGRLAEFHWRLGPIERRFEEWTDAATEQRPAQFGPMRSELGRLSADVRGSLAPLGHALREPEGAGTVSGLVTGATSGAPIEDAEVRIYDAGGILIASAPADASGAYLVSSLAAGTYYARTDNRAGYLDQLHGGRPCLGRCDVTAGESIAVEVGGAGIADFALHPGGRLGGTITDHATGDGIAAAFVDVYDAGGNWVTWGHADDGGDYLSRAGLPAGRYFAVSSNWLSYRNQLYDDAPCFPFCDVTVGTPIAVVPGATTAGIDFALEPGAAIAGTIRDAATGRGIAESWVSIYDADGNWVTAAGAAPGGEYRSPAGLPAGSYFALTGNFPGYLNQPFGGRPCSSCKATGGRSIRVGDREVKRGVDFGLESAGAIAGRVTDAATGKGIEGIYVDVFDAAGAPQTHGVSGEGGRYLSRVDLKPGLYYARTAGGHDYVHDLYDRVSCADCDVTAGKPIKVASGATTGGVDFALERGGSIAGKVTDAATSKGIESLRIRVFDAGGNQITSAVTGAYGAWATTFASLRPGTYYARTTGRRHPDQLYGGLPCEGTCDVTAGKPVEVEPAAVTGGVDFRLRRTGVFADGFESGDLSAWSSVTPPGRGSTASLPERTARRPRPRRGEIHPAGRGAPLHPCHVATVAISGVTPSCRARCPADNLRSIALERRPPCRRK
ncbi:MAG: carboxypeptidase regulatory-like domain-containing protein [bacterium]|nr:carboxypeptidase regulatory-like domain-containing protein [bacterium]